MAGDSDNRIFFPVGQQEQAQHKHSGTLLATDVYNRICDCLLQSTRYVDSIEIKSAQLNHESETLDSYRIHDAILVDGDRGTGKSTVLVNIKSYLSDFLSSKGEKAVNVEDYLWLKPIDPTVMESSDDLLLNTIVAALLSNRELKKALQKDTSKAESFHKQLQDLSRALEGTQTHREKFGIDKLRSFMGNQGLAEQIHRLYHLAASITEKKLVVLPIDDVDTSLHLAYENVEVIRKYLASPYVLPIVSGNIDLYHEVIWRHFHGRLTKDSRAHDDSAIIKAQELSRNYQQKVFPLPRQLRMPTTAEYFANDNIFLSCSNDKNLSLKFFYFWVESVVNQQTSADLSNYLNIPVNSIRDLVQLVDICSEQIEQLDEIKKLSKNMVNRLTIMPSLTAEAVDNFASDYGQAADEIDDQERRRKRDLAYQSLELALLQGDKQKYRDIAKQWQEQLAKRTSILLGWNHQLQEYLRHKRNGGQSFFVCLTNEIWLKLGTNKMDEKDIGYSVLNTPLFNPLDSEYRNQFDLNYKNKIQSLYDKALNSSQDSIKLSLFNFPEADLGKPTEKLRSIVTEQLIENDRTKNTFDIFYSLTHHRAVDKTGRRYDCWQIGRIFELLATSLIKRLNVGDFTRLISRPPYYCEASLLQKGSIVPNQYQEETLNEESEELIDFVNSINEWRELHFVQVPSSWLIHQLMIKVYENVKDIYRGEDIKSEQEFITLCYRAFIMIVGACGSVEKSNVFGLGQGVALIEVGESVEDFGRSDLYNVNIRPFTELPKGIGSVTRSLFYHPIGRMLRQAIDYFKNQDKDMVTQTIAEQGANKTNKALSKKKSQLQRQDDIEPDVIKEGSTEIEQQESQEHEDSSYSEASIDEELEADESLEDLDYGEFKVIADIEVSDFDDLKVRYGEEQLRNMAEVAGVVFYMTYSMFKGRSIAHGHIKSLTKEDFGRLDVQSLAQNMIDAGLPKDFILINFRDPKRFLSAKSNYRKFTTFLAKFDSLGLSIDDSILR